MGQPASVSSNVQQAHRQLLSGMLSGDMLDQLSLS